MPWCPECGAEYREGFTRCSDCDVALTDAPPQPAEASAGAEWVTAASYRTVEEAHLARGLLEENGIPATVVDRHVVLNPFPQVDAAEVSVLVAPDDGARAAAVLAAAESGDDELPADAAAEPDPPADEPR